MAIFYVEGNDAQTIAAAASIENAAEQRARAEADKTGGKPMWICSPQMKTLRFRERCSQL